MTTGNLTTLVHEMLSTNTNVQTENNSMGICDILEHFNYTHTFYKNIKQTHYNYVQIWRTNTTTALPEYGLV